MICVTDGGVIKFIKKLDYTALTFHSFVIGYYFGESEEGITVSCTKITRHAPPQNQMLG